MPTRWGKPTEDEKWAEEMQQRKRRARILFIRRVVVAVVALAAIGGTLMWLLNVFNRQIGDCFDSHGELTYHKERCLAYGPPTFEVWLFAVGSVVIGLLVILSIVSLIVTSTGRARSTTAGCFFYRFIEEVAGLSLNNFMVTHTRQCGTQYGRVL